MIRRWTSVVLLSTAGTVAIFAATPAWAEEDVVSGVASGDIVVTARRVEERLQDVPISISVFNQEQLDNRNIVIAADLATYAPSVTVNQRYGVETSSFAIRGFVQDTGTAPSVGVYFADVTTPRANGGTSFGSNLGAGSFMDLQNVQVLKGPQGTLFGRNTTGGAILLVPQKPTDKIEGYVEGSAGDYDMWRLQGVLNVPLADTFKVRLGVDRMKREGYIRNRSGIGPKDFSDVNYFAARLSIVADLTPDLENYTVATYNHSFSNGFAPRVVACERDPTMRTGGAILVAQTACDQIDRQAARGDGRLDVEIPIENPFFEIEQWQVVNTTTWLASDTLTIKNIASYAEYYSDTNYSLSGENFFTTSPPLPAAAGPLIGIPFSYVQINNSNTGHGAAQATFTEELQLQGKTSDGAFDWQAGFYFERSTPLGYSQNLNAIFLSCTDVLALQCVNPYNAGSVSAARIKNTYDNKALYAQATYRLTERLALTGGVRYTWDKNTAISESTRFQIPANGSTPFQVCTDSLRLKNPDGTAPRRVTDPSQCRQNFEAKSDKPTWLINLDYKATDDLMVYGKWARGYRAGGIGLSNVGFETWEPEKVDSYEIGLKASYNGSVRGYFNVAAFYNDFSNQQLFATSVARPGTGVIGGPVIVNAGRSRISGVEVDASAMFFDNLKFDLGYSYLNTKIKSIMPPPLPVDSIYDRVSLASLEGDPLTLTPKNRLSLAVNYTLPLDESVGRITIGGSYTHTDKQLATRSTLAEYQFLPATDIFNLNVNWNDALGQPIDLSFFMSNVTNEVYPVVVNSSWFSAGFESLSYAPPRMWGFRLRYKFGD